MTLRGVADEVVACGFANDSAHTDVVDEIARSLTTTLFEQKWTDLVMGDVERQLNVSCNEHGKLVGRLRVGYAKMFGDSLALLQRVLTHLRGVDAALQVRGCVCVW